MGGVGARRRFERMREGVRALYDRNRQRGHADWCGYDYDFVCPSIGTVIATFVLLQRLFVAGLTAGAVKG